MNDVALAIERFNAGRDPERLAMKLRKMRGDPFVFLRGTCHLFYDRLPKEGIFVQAPMAWICGDLHLENFGSYKGDNRLAYFDINDFDEAALAPCTWDLVRFLASVRLGLRGFAIDPQETDLLCHTFAAAYAAALADGKPRWIERETAKGLVQELLKGVGQRPRAKFLDTRTDLKGKRRRIRCDGKKALAAGKKGRAEVKSFFRAFALAQDEPEFFKVIDVARRIAGTGSLGVERYIVLVEGKGSPDANYLLDLKEALPSAAAAHSPAPQPPWASEAERAVALENRLQAISVAFLHAVEMEGRPYILRGLQPSEDRVGLDKWDGKLRRLEEVLASMGQATAWAHLRGSGRSGSAIADELADFGGRDDWRQPLIEAAELSADRAAADWRAYAEAYDQGYFKSDA